MSRLACQRSAANAGGRLDDLGRVGNRQRLRDGARQFRRAQDRQRRARRQTAPFEKSDEAAHDRQAARHRTALDPGGAMGEIGPEIGRRQRAQRRQISAARRYARSGNRERRRGRDHRRRSCAPRRAARRRASPSTTDRLAQILARGKPRERHRFRLYAGNPSEAGRRPLAGRPRRKAVTPADSAIARS